VAIKTLDTLERLRTINRGADAVERGAKKTVAVGKEVADTGKKVYNVVQEPVGKAHKWALNTRPGKLVDKTVDFAAGKKKGARASAVYGAFTPVAGIGAKKGTEVAATAASHAGGGLGKLTGLALGGAAGALPGMIAGGAIGGALSQSAAARKGARAAKKAGKKAVAVTKKKYTDVKSDVQAGGNAALVASAVGDVKAAFGGKRTSRFKAFHKGYKRNKMGREISEDLSTLRSLSRRGRIKPSK
jgi:hypothetical protein